MVGDQTLLANMGIRAVQPYSLAPGVATQDRELPSLEPTLIFNTGAPIWIVDAAGTTLIVESGQAFFAGLYHQYCFSCAGGSQAGVHVRLSVAAAWRLLGPAAAACTDRAVLVADMADRRLMGSLARHAPPAPDATQAEEAVITFLNDALSDAPEPPPEIAWSLGQFAKPGAKMSSIAAELGWSRRRLVEQCRATTGMTPKALARIARYQRLLVSLTTDSASSWAMRSVDAGYCDQSHMIREFTAFTGLSPATYVKECVTFVQ